MDHHERFLTDLREDVEHEYTRRHDLLMTVRRLRSDLEKYRSEVAFVQLKNEREKRHLRDGLEAARRDTTLLKDQLESFVRDHKNMSIIIERVVCLRSRKRPRTDSAGGYDQHKT